MFSSLTFNMQNGQPWNEADPDADSVNLEGTLEFLLRQNADLIFLQEVERGYDGGRQVEPPPNYSWLRERLTGYHSVFAYPRPNPLEIPFGLGLAIFSRFPLKEFHRTDLPAADVTFEYGGIERKPSDRLLIGAAIEVEGRTLRIFNTHLQAFFMIGATSDKYCSQRNRIADILSNIDGPAIIGGDFNCTSNENLIGQFKEVGFETVQNSEVTWRRMPLILDHVFYNKFLRVEKFAIIPTLSSDHHAVKAEFLFA